MTDELTEPAKVDLETPDLAAANRAAFEQQFPGVLADGVVDAERLRELLDVEVVGAADDRERYGLMWAGKKEAVRSLQTPSRGTLVPDFEASVDWDTAQNIFIEGDNLEVLKLLQKAYNDQVKLIYIDPPYNTGNDFVYNDDFSDGLRGYLEFTGQLDVEGYRVSSSSDLAGRRHSRWLSMMHPRLILARNLLCQDGFIFISIDDNEVASLRALCDEVFGHENFVTCIMWKRKRETSNDSRNVAVQGEYVLVYSRSGEAQFALEPLDQAYLDSSYREPTHAFPDGLWRPVPLTVSKGLKGGGYRYEVTTPSGARHDRLWAYPQHRYDELLERGRIYFGENGGGVPQRIMYAHESAGKPVTNYWENTATNKAGKKRVLEMFGDNVFDTAKPAELIQRMIRLVPGDQFVVLDFFAGSGTTAHAVALQNAADSGRRRCISVNIPEPTSLASAARRGGFATVSAITEHRIRNFMEGLEGARSAGLRIERLSASNFRDRTSADPDDLFDLHESTLDDGEHVMEYIVQEVLLKEGVRLDATWERHKAADAPVIVAEGVAVVMSLDLSAEIADAALALEPKVVVFLEDSFAEADAVKANAFTNAKNAGIVMKTV